MQSLMQKEKTINLGPKMSYLGIFGLYFRKTVIIFEVTTLHFVKIQSFVHKLKSLYLGPKIPYLGILVL